MCMAYVSHPCLWPLFIYSLKNSDYCQTLLKINIFNCFHVLSSLPLSTKVWQDETLFLLGIWLLLLGEERGLEGSCIHIIGILLIKQPGNKANYHLPVPFNIGLPIPRLYLQLRGRNQYWIALLSLSQPNRALPSQQPSWLSKRGHLHFPYKQIAGPSSATWVFVSSDRQKSFSIQNRCFNN